MDNSVSSAPISPSEYGKAVQICIVCANEVEGPQCMFCGSKNFKIRSEKVVEVKERPKILWEGFLYKQGGALKNWRRRYFALNVEGQLSYHKTDQLHIKQLDEELGSFNVRGASIETYDLGVHEDRDGYVMGVLPHPSLVKSASQADLSEGGDPDRQYLLEAPGYVDRQKWIDCFLRLGAKLESHVEFKRFHTRSLIEGFASKKGGLRRNWKRRYFTMLKDPPVITYVAKKGHPKLLGSVEISKAHTYTLDNKKGFILKIKPPDAQRTTFRGPRTFSLKFQDEKQRNQWDRALGTLIAYLKNPKAGMDESKLSVALLESPISSSGIHVIAEEREDKEREISSLPVTPRAKSSSTSVSSTHSNPAPAGSLPKPSQLQVPTVGEEFPHSSSHNSNNSPTP